MCVGTTCCLDSPAPSAIITTEPELSRVRSPALQEDACPGGPMKQRIVTGRVGLHLTGRRGISRQEAR